MVEHSTCHTHCTWFNSIIDNSDKLFHRFFTGLSNCHLLGCVNIKHALRTVPANLFRLFFQRFVFKNQFLTVWKYRRVVGVEITSMVFALLVGKQGFVFCRHPFKKNKPLKR